MGCVLEHRASRGHTTYVSVRPWALAHSRQRCIFLSLCRKQPRCFPALWLLPLYFKSVLSVWQCVYSDFIHLLPPVLYGRRTYAMLC